MHRIPWLRILFILDRSTKPSSGHKLQKFSGLRHEFSCQPPIILNATPAAVQEGNAGESIARNWFPVADQGEHRQQQRNICLNSSQKSGFLKKCRMTSLL